MSYTGRRMPPGTRALSVASARWRNSLYLGIRITKSARVYSFITITIVEEDVWEAKRGRGKGYYGKEDRGS